MEKKEFGYATVWTDEQNVFNDGPRVEVNWSCVGSVPIEKAQQFASDLSAAIHYAIAEECRLGMRPDITSECRAIADGGDLVRAVKLYRTHTGCGLKEAVDAIRGI